jgi:hypothetical protein
MEVEVLGPLTVCRDGEWLEFGGPREQAVLNAAVEARNLRMRRLPINCGLAQSAAGHGMSLGRSVPGGWQ